MFRLMDDPVRREVWRELRARHPGFRAAVRADAEMTTLHRGERSEFRSRGDLAFQVLRLCWASDAFLAQVLYRLRARMQARRIPVLPRIAHRLSMMLCQMTIGDPVVMHPGVYIIHGQVVIDGIVEIGPGAVIGPWVSIGLQAGNVQGPTIGNDVHIGTGAKILGPVRIGPHAKVGANSVVVKNVEAGTIVVGVPAKAIG